MLIPDSQSLSAIPLEARPENLRTSYQYFLSPSIETVDSSRILLTGHSHQAWPDVAKEGILEAFADAAHHVDDKWNAVFERAESVREEIARVVDGQSSEIALAQNTHELFTRFLSALPLGKRPLVIATSGEFHSVYRQLSAAAQAGILEVEWVSSDAPSTLAERLIEALSLHGDRCSAVITSSVLFQSGAIVEGLEDLASACLEREVRLFIDAYHSFKVVPLSLERFSESQEIIYLSGGGYKYAQWGEGVCWLRVPTTDSLRPIFTGWFSDFAHLHEPRYDALGRARSINFGERPAERFAGSTFDPTSLYRAAKVSEFFNQHHLDISTLRAISLRQTQRLLDGLSDRLPPITPVEPERRGGFVAFRVEGAHEWSRRLRELHIFTDARGDALRFGPAPYLLDAEIDEAISRALTLCDRKGI